MARAREDVGEMSVTLLSGLPEANLGNRGLVSLKYVCLE